MIKIDFTKFIREHLWFAWFYVGVDQDGKNQWIRLNCGRNVPMRSIFEHAED